MTTFLAYTSPAAGHIFPLVPGLLELCRRGHDVHVRTDPALVAGLRRAGLAAEPVDPRIATIKPGGEDGRNGLRAGYRALLRRGALDGPDLERALVETDADVLLVDTLAFGAAVAAERSGMPWAITLPSLLPLPGAGIPPYGLGLAPASGPLGALRDRIGWSLVTQAYGRALLPGLNDLRAAAGLAPMRSALDVFTPPDRVLVLTGAPLEYPRTDLPANVSFLGASSWDPPDAVPGGPAYLAEDGDPWVLVTCSTDYQGDEQLAVTAIEALRDEPVRVLLTIADAAHSSRLPQAANVRIERFVAHGPVLRRAAAVVCHGGMGIVQKALSASVPIVAVPFGRDQPEVARRLRECGAGRVIRRRRLSDGRLRAAVREAIADRDAAADAGAVLGAGDPPGAFADHCEDLVGAPRALTA
ncbi:MAG TPA: nucleotide disphospho-sugar-binding domain-containing protein [Solirubrobacterales bacterium]|nr:nucleotide disphospho-sugar-binding domain-containing protein [Solirubrobacterales bacterium]